MLFRKFQQGFFWLNSCLEYLGLQKFGALNVWRCYTCAKLKPSSTLRLKCIPLPQNFAYAKLSRHIIWHGYCYMPETHMKQ